jgi:hypothetical protein
MLERGIIRRRGLYGLMNASNIFVFHAIFAEELKALTIFI